MLGVVVRKLVTLQAEVLGVVCDLLEKLADPEWVSATKRFLRKEDPWTKVEEVKQILLKAITNVALPAIEMFKAKDHFKVGEVRGVNIGWLGENFKQVFLNGKGKIEVEVPETTLRIHQLIKRSVDEQIIAELGGEKMAETTLAQVWQMFTKQGHGEAGDLRVDGYIANIFYVRDATGALWAVGCRWFSYGWEVGAGPVTNSDGWYTEGWVLSR